VSFERKTKLVAHLVLRIDVKMEEVRTQYSLSLVDFEFFYVKETAVFLLSSYPKE